MHFIEQLFGVTPDGGNGLLEVVLITLPLVMFVLIVSEVREKRASAGNGR